jgi:hypothetical protein
MGTPATQADAGAAVGLVPMAFVGRTSTTAAQDPVQSLYKQMRRAEERLPAGFYISRWYWDIESGGTDLDLRSRTDVWEKFAAAGIPRDGGMAQLRAAIAADRPPFAAVICENIERSGRDMFDALRLERELRRAGLRCSPPTSPSMRRPPRRPPSCCAG